MLHRLRDAFSWRWNCFLESVDEKHFRSRPQWVRHAMDVATKQRVSQMPFKDFSVLEISGSKWESFGFRKYRTIEYDEYDVCSGTLPETYDLIIIEQVLEHVLWPHRAVKNLFSMVAPQGYLLVTTPFMVGVHNAPIDCSRWTELGMKQLLCEAGFSPDAISTGSWGNRQCIKASFRRIPRYHPFFHSMENEPKFPQVVWAFAQRR
jgi:SAM-dependent methyltransferase